MFRHRTARAWSVSFFAGIIILLGAVVMGISPAPDPVKVAPALVTVDTSSLPPDEAQAELDAVWRLFDGDTTTVYTPLQTAQVTVTLAEEKTISRIRTFGASTYHVTVYRDNAGQWESVPSLTGIDLSARASSWNSLKATDPFNATHLLLEFIPQGNTVAGLPEIEVWGEEPSTTQGSSLHSTLAGIRTPGEMLAVLSQGSPHITEFIGAPSELTVTPDTGQTAYATINIPMTQDPVLFKRAYLLYDGYNILRPVSVGRRINGLSWTGGFPLSQPEGTTPTWSSHLEEINPAWLVQGENRIEFRSPAGTAYVRGLRLIVETSSGWNNVSAVSDLSLYDGDTNTSFAVATSSGTPEIGVTFEHPMEPEMLRLHLRGPLNVTAQLQYKSGGAWQNIQAGWQIDLSTMQSGWNDVTIPAPVATKELRLLLYQGSQKLKTGARSGDINELRVCASPVGPKSTDPAITISYPRDGEYFGRTAYIQGFARPAKDAANVAVTVSAEGKASPPSLDGSFSLSLTKDETRFSSQGDDEAWDPVVSSAYGTDQAASVILELTKNTESLAALEAEQESRQDAPFADNRDKHSEKVSPGQAKKIAYAGVSLDIPAGAVDADTEITIIPLTEAEIARMNPGMINVTYPAAGYRFLPHGLKFKKAIKISFAYHKAYFAAGQADDEVNMYYYDEKHLRWKQLRRVKVDSAASVVTSESDHFTDIINSTLVVPEHPQALSFNPNSIKDIKAADPSANIDLIEPPQANPNGTANLSYPIQVPRGRGAYTPSLQATYSSSNTNGWMGLGWDISVPKIQVDTRWGVPRYDGDRETESYLLDGAMLSPHVPRPFVNDEVLAPRSAGDKIFRQRVEGNFMRIVRKKTAPNENDPSDAYYWEVTDKDGTKFTYGQSSSARLSDYGANKNIFQWNLEKVVDSNGNAAQFIYETDSDNNGEPYKQIYLKEIVYTGHETSPGSITPGAYKVVFHRADSRPDVIIDGKPGFQVLTGSLLERVDVKYNNEIIRQYLFTYMPEEESRAYHFGKSLLQKITVMGRKAEHKFYSHEFSYEKMETAGSGYQGFKPEVKQWGSASSGKALTESEDKMTSVALSLTIGFSSNYPTYGLQGNYGFGSSQTEGLFMDVNGDGLPDRLSEGGSVELNTLDAGRDSGSFTGAHFSGIAKLGYNRQDNFSIGAQIGYWIAAANFSYSYNFVNTEQLMSDIDGDGLVDKVELSGDLKVRKNTGTQFEDEASWNAGYSMEGVDFGNDAISAELKDDFFLTDPVRKWIAPYKGTITVDGIVEKISAGGQDDPYDPSDPDALASVLAFIYRNDTKTPLWTGVLGADGTTTASHSESLSVVPGDRLYFRVNSIDDSEADDVSWQPVITYETVCVGPETCPAVEDLQYQLLDPQGHSLLKFDTASDTRISGAPWQTWGAGGKGTVVIKGAITKSKTTDDVVLTIRLNNVLLTPDDTVTWPLELAASDEGVYSHDFKLHVMPGDQLTFQVASDTTVDPDLVKWQPEITYETYCLKVPYTDPAEYSCGPVICEPDEEGIVQCRIDVPELPEEAEIEEKDLYHYGQVNYPLYYRTPTTLSRFWVAPYDGTVRVKDSITRYDVTEKFLAISRGVNRLLWKQHVAEGGPEPPEDPNDPAPPPQKIPHDFEVTVKAGDQLFFDIYSAEAIEAGSLSWAPRIVYTEYCESGQDCKPITEVSPDTVYGYCENFDDDDDGTADRTVCTTTTCPANTGPQSGACEHCVTTTYIDDPAHPDPVQQCQPIVCQNDPIEGPTDCEPLSFIYKSRPANFRYLDDRYYDDDHKDSSGNYDAEPFAGGYRQWHYGDWNGNKTWDESEIRRTRESDLPDDPKDYDPENYKDQPSYYFITLTPQWQGVEGYAEPLWRGRGEKNYIGSGQQSPSRLGANVSGIITGTTISTLQQSVSENRAFGASAIFGASFSRGNSEGKLDFMDMNGDRFPDQVSSGSVLFNNGVAGFNPDPYGIPVGTVRNIYNDNTSTMLSFTLPQNKQDPKGVTVKVTTLGASLGNANGTSDTLSDLIDVNGDGLPDRVSKGTGSLSVSLNLGYRFGGPIAWDNADGTVQRNKNETFNFAASFWGIGGGASSTEAMTERALRDINGDGLADQVVKTSGSSAFLVKLNRGDRFGNTEVWNAPEWNGGPGEDALNYVATDSYFISGGVVIMIPIPIIPAIWIDIAPTVSVSGGVGGSELELSDINGDGFADHVLKKDGSGTVYARVNNVGTTNLLKEVKRPLGGKFTVDYRLEGNTPDWPQSQWVLEHVKLHDGMKNTYDTHYDYGDGYYSRDEREFYGFDYVKQTKAFGTTVARTATQHFNNQDYYKKNLMEKSVTIDATNRVWARTKNIYLLSDVSAGSKFPELRQTDNYFYDGTKYSEDSWAKYTTQLFEYDTYGNVSKFTDLGETGVTGDNIIATISYTNYTGSYIIKPEAILVTDNSGAKELRKRVSTYDPTTGNMERLTLHNTAEANSVWAMTYDDYGNIKAITDSVGYELTYTYDDVVHTYVTRTQDNFDAANGGPYSSSATYNYFFGEMATSTDLNGNHQVNLYGEFGRLEAVCGPYDAVSGSPPVCKDKAHPTIAFKYPKPAFSQSDEDNNLLEKPAGAITENKAVWSTGEDPDTIDTVIFTDGMKRMVQTKIEADVLGTYGMTVSGLKVYDDLGRVSLQDQPVFMNTNLYEYVDLKDQSIQPKRYTQFSYDTLDRTTRVITPDNATTTMAYGFGVPPRHTATMMKITVIDPEGNKPDATHLGKKVSYKDVRDKIVAVVEFNRPKEKSSVIETITTTYAYDPLGQIRHVWDDKLHHTEITYDKIGNRTSIENPDTGTTSYEYDRNWNMVKKTTANYQNGKPIRYLYTFNRLREISYTLSTNVVYTYGAMHEAYNRAGRITRVTDESGEETRYYGKLGEVTREEKIVNAKTPPVQRKKFTTEYVFDSFGRMQKMTYPDGEVLTYAYDNGGLLKAAWGKKKNNRYDYIKTLTYDEFGKRKKITYGNGTGTTYSYDENTRRLNELISTLNDGRKIQNISYTYDLVGNVGETYNRIGVATNTALPAGPVKQTFIYDDLYQLRTGNGYYTFKSIRADDPMQTGHQKENNYYNHFTYDSIGNMKVKTQEHTIYQPSLQPHQPKKTNYVINYQYKTQGSTKPHAVTETDDKVYTYDAAGNMTEWTHKQNGTRRTITWNEENRVKQIDDNGKSTYFLYNDAGERVVKRGQHGETLYVNRFYSVRNGQLGTKSVFAGETRVVSKLVKTPNTVNANTSTTSTSPSTTTSTTSTPGEQGLDHGRGKKLGIIRRLPDGYETGVNPPVEKDLFYFHGDHLGSSNMITDAYGAVYQHLEYFPFGETWIEEGGSYGGNTPGYKFTGKELDPETGLYYYGARYYDPVLSKWISADPALPKFLPSAASDVRISAYRADIQRDSRPRYGSSSWMIRNYNWNPIQEEQSDIDFIHPMKGSNKLRYPAAKVYHPVKINLYCYAQNNPVKLIDPTGLDEEETTPPLSDAELRKKAIEIFLETGAGKKLIEKVEKIKKWGEENPKTRNAAVVAAAAVYLGYHKNNKKEMKVPGFTVKMSNGKDFTFGGGSYDFDTGVGKFDLGLSGFRKDSLKISAEVSHDPDGETRVGAQVNFTW